MLRRSPLGGRLILLLHRRIERKKARRLKEAEVVAVAYTVDVMQVLDYAVGEGEGVYIYCKCHLLIWIL